ncbi:MAG: TetR family transcriptional regulator [Ignavibacteria bacterium]|nr:TetR family transcriptional regulator [Ignavibacteria bacterium]
MKRTKDDAELTKKKLIEFAFKELINSGFENAGLESIAVKAGVTRGAVYWHFKNKDDLLDSIIEYKDLESLKLAGEIFNSEQDPFEKLKQLVSLNFPEFSSPAKEKRYIRMKVELYNYLNKKGDKRKIAENFIKMCKDLLDECNRKNELKSGIDTESAAHTILSICAGSYIRFNSVPEKLRSISQSKKIALEYLNLIHK